MEKLAYLLDLFDWSSMTIAEKSDMVRNLGLLFSAAVGVVFLAWRAISNDRIARAALRQAQVATSQLQLARTALELQTRQVEAVNQQVTILSNNAEISNRALQQTLENNLYGHFRAAMTTLAEAETNLHRVAGIVLVAEAARANREFCAPALLAFENFARHISSATALDIDEIEVIPTLEGDDTRALAQALKRLPVAYWLDLKPGLFGHVNVHRFLMSLDVREGAFLSIEQQQAVKFLWKRITTLHPALAHRFWYGSTCKPELQTMLDALGTLKEKYPNLSIPLSRIRLDGYDFAVKNFSRTQLHGSSLRGANCHATNFSGAMAVACDFRTAWLSEADFSNADLSYCDFAGCALERATFTNANINGARFAECLNFERAQLNEAKNVDQAVFGSMPAGEAVRPQGAA